MIVRIVVLSSLLIRPWSPRQAYLGEAGGKFAASGYGSSRMMCPDSNLVIVAMPIWLGVAPGSLWWREGPSFGTLEPGKSAFMTAIIRVHGGQSCSIAWIPMP